MAKLEYSGFRGILPRTNPTLLPKGAAQIASNCALWHGDLRPLKAPAAVVTPAPIGRAIRTIYRMGQDLGEAQYWLAWGTDVDVVRGFVSTDTDERTFFTGDGPPKWTTLPMATQGGTSYPVQAARLGVPRPVNAPKLRSGGSSAATSPSGATIGTTQIESRVYVYTFVNDLGEEGPISPPASISCDNIAGCWLGGTDATADAQWRVVKKRLYRSVTTGTNSGAYFFEAEFAMSEATADPDINENLRAPGGIIYASTALSSALSDELITADFIAPPADLQGLVAMPNGILAGFSGYDLWFSEPNYPYAWPAKYNLTVDYPVVGLGVFGSTLVVLTKGVPYLVNGSDPASFSMDKVALDQACVSKRSICSVGNGVVYASPDGLAYVGAGTPQLITEDHFTRDEWQMLPTTSMKGYYHDGKYVCIHDAGAFVINSLEDRELVNLTLAADCGHVDLRTDSLYLMINGAIQKYNAGTPYTLTWRGKREQANGRPAPKCAKVQADSYPVTFNLYADGALKYTAQVNDQHVFRLPAGYRAQVLEAEVVTSAGPILMFGVADSPEEFRNG